MRGRKRRRGEGSETLRSEEVEEDREGDRVEGESRGFYACYLLVSLSPRHKGHTYIGFTVNPRRRIRQHNGEIGCGAWRTKKRRPWEMVLCIYGFPTNVSALQFEWAWQHPNESLAVRKAAASFKSLSGIANKIKLAYTMLTLPSWQSLNITVNYFSTKYTQHSAGSPSLPECMKVRVRAMDELPCYVKWDESLLANDDDDEWDNEAFNTGKVAEQTSSDSISGNPEEHFQSSVEKVTTNELYGWNMEGEGCRKQSNFTESPERPSSNVSSSSVVIEIGEDTGVSRSINDSNFGLKQSAREQHTALLTADAVPSEVEVVDVTTPSPLCRSSLWGKKFCQRERNKERHIVPSEAEVIDLTTPSPLFRSSLWGSLVI